MGFVEERSGRFAGPVFQPTNSKIMKNSSLLLLAALLPLAACQTSDQDASAQDVPASHTETVEGMAMSSFQLAKVP